MQKYSKNAGECLMSKSQLTTAPKKHIDARKFLGNINKKGFAGQIRMAESKLQKLADDTGSKLRLVSYFGDSIYFEDTSNNEYYQADLDNKSRSINNIKSIVVEDKDKAKVFDEACDNLINYIEESIDDGDYSKAEQVFGRIATGYCTPRVIPECGRVRTRDGSIHNIKVADSLIPEEYRPEVVKTLKQAIKSSNVVIKEGSLSVGDEKVNIPINETTRRISVARSMKSVAENAHNSDNFNRLIKTVAGHVSNNGMKDAVGILKTFLSEEQEFTLLDKQGVYTLIENTLYRQGVFNYHTMRNTALLFWETNCYLNKNDIIKEWSTAASKCGNKQLAENIGILKNAAGKSPVVFSDAVDKFNQSIFNEDRSTRTVKARAYLNMLKMLNNVVTGSDADEAVKGAVDDLILRLESDIEDVDDATLFEVEDLLATVSTDLINDTSTLSDFNATPEPFNVDTFGSDEDVGDFEGDMGDAGDMGDIGGGVDAEADEAIDDAEAAAGDDEEEEEELDDDDLQLDHLVNKSKPINEMEKSDIKAVLEALKKIKPEVVEVDGEFKKMLKSGLTESHISFVRKVMDHSKSIDNDLYEGLTSSYYDLVIAENDSEVESDIYDFGGNGDIDINEDYTGINENDALDKGGKDEAGLDGSADNGIDAASLSDKDEVVDEGFKKNLEGDEEGDLDGDHDDNHVDESIAVVSADNDEKLLDMIDKVLGNTDADNVDDADDAETDGDDDTDGDTGGGDTDDDNMIVDGSDEYSGEADPDQDGIPIWKDEDDQNMKEDNNITDPSHSEFDSEGTADKHGDGTKINDKPKFSDKDYDGTSGAKTGKDNPGSGHPTSGK